MQKKHRRCWCYATLQSSCPQSSNTEEGINLILYTVGPVQMDPAVLAAGAQQPPYFRTDAYSKFMLGLENDLLKLMDAPQEARAVFLSASGSGGMEASLASMFSPTEDRILVITAGTFGDRFVQLCEALRLPHDVLNLAENEELASEHLEKFAGHGYTGVTVNHCETSNGKLQDLRIVSEFAKREGALTIVDAVSSFLCEPLSMKELNIDLILTASQKALALSPGIAPVVVGPSALARIKGRAAAKAASSEDGLAYPYYLDLNAALVNMERGQTPYTPSISVLQQLRARLDQLNSEIDQEIRRVKDLASYFRKELTARTSFTVAPWRMAAGVTLVVSDRYDMEEIYHYLDNAGLVLNPCGGLHAKKRIRVGHMGTLTKKDYDHLLDQLARYEDREEDT